MTADPMVKEAEEVVGGNRGDKDQQQKDTVSELDKSINSDEFDGRRRRQPRRDRSPVVLKRGMRGTVKWFSPNYGYGFICREDNETDIFVHASSIVRQTRQPLVLSEHLEVEFDVVKGPKGLEAACVSGPDGKRVGGFYGQRVVLVNKQPFQQRPVRRHSDGNVLNSGGGKQERKEIATGDKEGAATGGKQSPKKQKGNNRRQGYRRFNRTNRAPAAKNAASVEDNNKEDSTSTAVGNEEEVEKKGEDKQPEGTTGSEDKEGEEAKKEDDEEDKENKSVDPEEDAKKGE